MSAWSKPDKPDNALIEGVSVSVRPAGVRASVVRRAQPLAPNGRTYLNSTSHTVRNVVSA